MSMIFTSSDLWETFNKLTHAARCYTPPQLHSTEPEQTDVLQLMEAAVSFTVQLAIDTTARDQVAARALEADLISKLETWRDEGGGMKLRLLTYDVECVIGGLNRAALSYAHPRAHPPESAVKHAAEILPRNLAIAAVALTIELAIEDAGRDPAEMRTLERDLIQKLEEPWKIGAIALSVDASSGQSWGQLAKEEA